MKRSTSRWATAMAAAALIALPAASYAQAPASPQPQPQTPSTQTPASQASQASASSPAAEHVRAAKQAVSSIQGNSLPASERPKLAQLKSHLNNLEKEVNKAEKAGGATASAKSKGSANWGTEVAAIDKIITEMIGPETGSAASTPSMSSGTAGSATGTSGQAPATIDEATKQQLRAARREITDLATSMSGSSAPKSEPTPNATAPEAAAAAASPSAASAGAPSPTANPSTATPAQAAPPESAQAPTSTAPQTQTQTQTTPSATQQTTPSSAQPPATAEPQSGQVDREAAKQHLSAARESLSQLAGLPEAAKLQGESRNQISQLIANFNELITTQSDWKASYAKLDATLNSLLGASPAAPETPATAGTTGTTTPAPAGTSGTANTLDPAIRAKLEEFKTHMTAFAQAAGGAPQSGAMSPSVKTGSANNPANPEPSAMSPASPSAPAATPSTPEATPSTPSASATTPSQTPAASPSTASPSATPGATGTTGTMSPSGESAGANAEADKHLDAIDAILSKAKDGKLDKDQTEQIKMHLEQLRQLLKK
jgi:hypothetical protein